MTLALLAVAATVAGITPASGIEYFVAKPGVDTANGLSRGSAFATIAKGVSVLKPGDTLTIYPGVYREAVSARLSGAPDAPITIRAWRPGSVLMRGDVDLRGFRRAEGARYTYVVKFNQRVEGISERSTFRTYRPKLTVAEVEQTLDSFHQDEEAGLLYVHSSDSRHPDAHRLCASVTDGFGILLTPRGSGTVSDVIIDGLSFTGYRTREFPTGPGSRARWGLHVVKGERVEVRRCTAFLNDGGIYLLASRDSVVEDCYAFANHSRFLDLGNNILGWSVQTTTFRNNVVEGFWKGSGSSNDDITFYGGGEGLAGAMENNLAINAGLMVKGGYGQDTVQKGNIVVGKGAYFYRKPDATNLLLRGLEGEKANRNYVDPLRHDYRLQSDAPLRGTGPDGADPGPYPYRDEVFFVSPDGDNAAKGTSLKQAWRTLSHAAARAQPGHTVYVTAGEYREPLVPARSGTEREPIRFLRRGRDRVVLEGEGRHAIGIDLSGRSHIQVQGLTVRNFSRNGVRLDKGASIQVERVLILEVGEEGVRASETTDFSLSHCLTRDCKSGGLRMDRCPGASVAGNVFDRSDGPRVRCDATSLEGLWCDFNAFAPTQAGRSLIQANGGGFEDLKSWTGAHGHDRNSIVTKPGYRHEATEGDPFILAENSPLIGRGPHASVIGPFLRLTERESVTIESATVRSVTDTTANLEWWSPTAATVATLAYGETPQCTHERKPPRGILHTSGLIGLRPGTDYFFRITAGEGYDRLLFASSRIRGDGKPAQPQTAETHTFETLAERPTPRTFHVAVDGDDAKSGRTLEDAWRTLAHAAGQVAAGDTVLVHAGEYREYVRVRATGDEGAPITFRAAPGEVVWLDGSARSRTTAFQLNEVHRVHLDGLRFRHFRYVPHAGDPINIRNGSGHAIRRCLYDGRERSGYVGNFVRAYNAADLLVENCVMINGMGHGMVFYWCPNVTVRHCVFYNNFIRTMTVMLRDPKGILTLSHNLICANLPQKTGVPLLRISDLKMLRSDHNGYYTRVGAKDRYVLEVFAIGGKPVGRQGAGSYYGRKMKIDEVRNEAGQERHSVFANPGIRVVKELVPSRAPRRDWMKREMHWDGKAFLPLDFEDFMVEPAGSMGHSAAGEPIGLEPDAFQTAGKVTR